MAVNILVLVSILIFYVLITAVGIWAARTTRHRGASRPADTLIAGKRDVGILVGVCTVTASWIGGGALNGTSETVYSPSSGLIWCVAPVCYALSLITAGMCFAKRMRDKNYLTVLDPIEEKVGKHLVVLYFCIEIINDILYTSAILNALGGTLEVIAGFSRSVSVISSAGVATFYTLLGGFYSVAYTDVIQLAFMILGLVLSIPFAISHEAVDFIGDTFLVEGGWSGTWNPDTAGVYVDTVFLTLFGAIPIQAAFQRFLAIDTTAHTKLVSVMGGMFSILLLIPPVIIGAIGASTNWTMTEYLNGTGLTPADMGNQIQILPLVIQHLTPPAVSIFGLGAVTAAVMSSADASGLAFGAIFGRNIYNALLRPKASQKEVVWAIRGSILVFGIAAATVAIKVKSIMILYILCSDLTYVLTLPQFVCSLYLDTNVYGTILGIVLGLIFRIGGGEYLLDIPPLIKYIGGTNFPVKTFSMIITFLSTVIVSYIAKCLFNRKYLSKRYDFLKVFQHSDIKITTETSEKE